MRERLALLVRIAGPPLAAGLVLGLLGPFGTHGALPLAPRLAYWTAVVPPNWLLCDAVIRLAERALPQRTPPILAPLIGALAGAVPATAVVHAANRVAGMPAPSPTVLLGYVALICVLIALLSHVMRRAGAVARERPPPAPAAASPPPLDGLTPVFRARIDGGAPGRVLCIETQDHYLVVHGDAGRRLILCRMEDAARELAGAGRRVHRSWWVANWAVRGVEREGGRALLRLADGRRVPVGRTYRDALAGWRALA